MWRKPGLDALVQDDHGRNRDVIPEYLHEELPLPSISKSSNYEVVPDSQDNGVISFSITKQTTV